MLTNARTQHVFAHGICLFFNLYMSGSKRYLRFDPFALHAQSATKCSFSKPLATDCIWDRLPQQNNLLSNEACMKKCCRQPNTNKIDMKWSFSSVVEQLTTNQWVAGSIPASSLLFDLFCRINGIER
jgi:hypothetical protein